MHNSSNTFPELMNGPLTTYNAIIDWNDRILRQSFRDQLTEFLSKPFKIDSQQGSINWNLDNTYWTSQWLWWVITLWCLWCQIAKVQDLGFQYSLKNIYFLDMKKAALIFNYKLSPPYWCCSFTLKSSMGRVRYQSLQKEKRKCNPSKQKGACINIKNLVITRSNGKYF